jgi:hypothetical protein
MLKKLFFFSQMLGARATEAESPLTVPSVSPSSSNNNPSRFFYQKPTVYNEECNEPEPKGHVFAVE